MTQNLFPDCLEVTTKPLKRSQLSWSKKKNSHVKRTTQLDFNMKCYQLSYARRIQQTHKISTKILNFNFKHLVFLGEKEAAVTKGHRVSSLSSMRPLSCRTLRASLACPKERERWEVDEKKLGTMVIMDRPLWMGLFPGAYKDSKVGWDMNGRLVRRFKGWKRNFILGRPIFKCYV